MASTALTLSPTVTSLSGGVNAFGGQGETYQMKVSGSWVNGDTQTLVLTDSQTGLQTQLGAGNVTGIVPTYAFTFGQKLHFLAGDTIYFSDLAAPTVFNDPNGAGNGFITLTDYFSAPDNAVAAAPYQGKLLLAFRRQVQIWAMDPDPASNALTQTLPNIGTIAPLSVQAVGDMDVYMLADNGVRSVRVRDASNNAIIADIGTPIDAIVQSVLATLTDTQKANACGIVDPTSNRYMLFIPDSADVDNGVGKIYVFSYFPSSQIAAWSTYSPTYQAAIAAPAANYTASQVTYTGLTVGKRYAWKPGAHEVSITNGTSVLKVAGSFVATATTALVAGTGAAVTFTGALTLTTAFTPEKFIVYKGQIFARGSGDNQFYQYGGANGNTYENCGVTAQTPYMDNGEPATTKLFDAVDAGFQGTWTVKASADYVSQGFKSVYANSQSSFQRQRMGYGATGTHYALQMIEDSAGYALFSSAAMHISVGNKK